MRSNTRRRQGTQNGRSSAADGRDVRAVRHVGGPSAKLTGYLSYSHFTLALMPFLAISVLVRSFKSLILGAYLRSRPDGFPRIFSQLPRRTFGLEDGATYQKVKFLIEDSGICFFDERQQLVISKASNTATSFEPKT